MEPVIVASIVGAAVAGAAGGFAAGRSAREVVEVPAAPTADTSTPELSARERFLSTRVRQLERLAGVDDATLTLAGDLRGNNGKVWSKVIAEVLSTQVARDVAVLDAPGLPLDTSGENAGHLGALATGLASSLHGLDWRRAELVDRFGNHHVIVRTRSEIDEIWCAVRCTGAPIARNVEARIRFRLEGLPAAVLPRDARSDARQARDTSLHELADELGALGVSSIARDGTVDVAGLPIDTDDAGPWARAALFVRGFCARRDALTGGDPEVLFVECVHSDVSVSAAEDGTLLIAEYAPSQRPGRDRIRRAIQSWQWSRPTLTEQPSPEPL